MNVFFRLLILTGALVASCVQAATAPPPSIGVSPSRLEVTLGGKTTMGSTTVLNMSDRDITVKASVVGFDLDDTNNFRELAPEPGELATAMMIDPMEFTIPANGSQTVRFAIMPERLKGRDEHRAMLFFSELVDTNHAGVKLNFRLGMPIYANFGEPNPIAVFNGVEFDPVSSSLAFDISSIGTSQVKPIGYYMWWPLSDYPSEARALRRVSELASDRNRQPRPDEVGGLLMTKPVFAGTRRTVLANLPPPQDSGEHMLVVHLEAGGQRLQRVFEYAPADMLIVDSDD